MQVKVDVCWSLKDRAVKEYLRFEVEGGLETRSFLSRAVTDSGQTD